MLVARRNRGGLRPVARAHPPVRNARPESDRANAADGSGATPTCGEGRLMGIKPQTEKRFMQTVIDYARLRGWLVYHALDSRGSAPGFPDLVFARDGDVVFAELKIGSKKPTKDQLA